MKKHLLFLMVFVLLLFPSSVFAKEVSIDDLLYGDDNIILKTGDVVIFESHDFYKIFHIYIDGVRVDDNYYFSGLTSSGLYAESHHSYTVGKNVILSGETRTQQQMIDEEHMTNYDVFNLNFITYKDNYKFYKYTDISDGQTFSSGDIINFNVQRNDDLSIYFYKKNRELDFSELVYFDVPIKNYLFPEVNGEKAYWKVEFFDDGLYLPGVFPHFYQLEYIGPKFTIKCKDKVINYGKKTTCSLCVTSLYEMSDLSFNMDLPNFKISNIDFPDEIENLTGTKQYNFRIASGYVDGGKEVELMTFDLEGTKNENYTDGIDLTNIQYRDELVDGSYDKVTSSLEILPNTITNPKTITSLLYLLLPIAVLLVALTMVKLNERNKKEI